MPISIHRHDRNGFYLISAPDVERHTHARIA
jgi:hypothetical protein